MSHGGGGGGGFHDATSVDNNRSASKKTGSRKVVSQSVRAALEKGEVYIQRVEQVHYHTSAKTNELVYIKLNIGKLYRDSDVVSAHSFSYAVKIECTSEVNGSREKNTWVVRRNVADFKTLDHILHGGCEAIEGSREMRGLPPLHPPSIIDQGKNSYEVVFLQYSNYLDSLNKYLERTKENGNLLLLSYFNCSLIFSWFEISDKWDHRSHVLKSFDLPKGASFDATTIKRFPKQAMADLNLEVTEIVVVVETVSPEDSAWAKGKSGSTKTPHVGFFPACCVKSMGFTNVEKLTSSAESDIENLRKQKNIKEEGKSEEHLPPKSNIVSLPPKPISAKSPSTPRRDGSGVGDGGDVDSLASPSANKLAAEPPLSVRPIFGFTLDRAMEWNTAVSETNSSVLKYTRKILRHIYTLEGIFCEETLDRVPLSIQLMVSYVHEKGQDADGIYRLSGSNGEIQQLISALDHGNHTVDFSNFDIHSISSLLKQFLRELSEPVIPVNSYLNFMLPFEKCPDLMNYGNKAPPGGNKAASVVADDDHSHGSNHSSSNDAVKIKKGSLRYALDHVHECLYELPPNNYHTLKLIMLHLKFFASKVGQTNMGLYNLAIMWAPNLLFHPLEKTSQNFFEVAKMAQDTAAVKGKLIHLMIEFSPQLFDDHLSRSVLEKINELGCKDKLRAFDPKQEPATFAPPSDYKRYSKGFSPKKPDSKSQIGYLKKIVSSKFGPKRKSSSVKEARSLSVTGDNLQINRDNSIESGIYACVNNNHTLALTGSESDLTERQLDKSPVVYCSSSTDDEVHSDDSFVGSRDWSKYQLPMNIFKDDPETHMYSVVQKEKSFFSDFESECLERRKTEDTMPFIDSPSSPTDISSLSEVKSPSSRTLSSKSTSSSAKRRSPPVAARKPTHGYDYNYEADCTLDNYSSDKAYPTRSAAAALCTTPSTSTSTIRSTLSTSSSLRSSPYSKYFTKDNSPRSRQLGAMINLGPASMGLSLPQSLPSSLPPQKNIEILPSNGIGHPRPPVASFYSPKSSLYGKDSTNCSFDSGVENNTSSNDDLLSNEAAAQ